MAEGKGGKGINRGREDSTKEKVEMTKKNEGKEKWERKKKEKRWKKRGERDPL